MRTEQANSPPPPGRPITVPGVDPALARELDLLDAGVIGDLTMAARRRIELTRTSGTSAISVAKDTLRESLRRQWEKPRLPGRLAGGRRSWPTAYPWSASAAAALAEHGSTRLERLRGLALDHVTPLEVGLTRLLDPATPVDAESLTRILPDLLGGVVITEAEHQQLTAAGVGSQVPNGHDPTDPWARHRHAGIDVAAFTIPATAARGRASSHPQAGSGGRGPSGRRSWSDDEIRVLVLYHHLYGPRGGGRKRLRPLCEVFGMSGDDVVKLERQGDAINFVLGGPAWSASAQVRRLAAVPQERAIADGRAALERLRAMTAGTT